MEYPFVTGFSVKKKVPCQIPKYPKMIVPDQIIDMIRGDV
jgi:hypothetical protein